jgi:hypothetical protein
MSRMGPVHLSPLEEYKRQKADQALKKAAANSDYWKSVQSEETRNLSRLIGSKKFNQMIEDIPEDPLNTITVQEWVEILRKVKNEVLARPLGKVFTVEELVAIATNVTLKL